jgi:NAD(P)-dependent dehydrogenase (short-subunit alcohol dehydrogenase family)
MTRTVVAGATKKLYSTDSRPLEGKHAWVTGAGRGIGRAAALSLAELGASVTVLSRTESEVAETADRVAELGVSATPLVCDVCDLSQVADAFTDAEVDVLVNSAGTNIPTRFTEVSEDVYDTIMTVNVKATLFVTQHAVRRMLHTGRGGAIVNVSSQMGHVGGPNRVVYCASKFAVEGLTRALALELGPAGIRVNTVAPTFVETEMTATGLADPDFRRWVLDQLPIGRLGRVEEVASVIAFLASPSASLITGTSLIVDGGWTAH